MWIPDAATVARSNIAKACSDLGEAGIDSLYRLSIDDAETFWSDAITKRTGIVLRQPFTRVFQAAGPAQDDWRSVQYCTPLIHSSFRT